MQNQKIQDLSSINIHLKKRLFFNNFLEITKVRLSASVLFSSIAGYLLGTEIVHITEVLLLCVGGYSMVGASNGYNQIIEKFIDEENIVYLENPSLGAEDFAFFLQDVPGTMFRLGVAGNQGCAPLHSGNFSLDERSMELGINILSQLDKVGNGDI